MTTSYIIHRNSQGSSTQTSANLDQDVINPGRSVGVVPVDSWNGIPLLDIRTLNIDFSIKKSKKRNKKHKKQKKKQKFVDIDSRYVFSDDSFIPTILNKPVKRAKNDWKNIKARVDTRPREHEKSFEKAIRIADYERKHGYTVADAEAYKKKHKAPEKEKKKRKPYFDVHADLTQKFRAAMMDGQTGLFDPAENKFSLYSALFGVSDILSSKYLIVIERFYNFFKVLRPLLSCKDRVARAEAILSLVINEVTHYTGRSAIQDLASYITGLQFPFSVQADEPEEQEETDTLKEFQQFFCSVNNAWKSLRDSPLASMLYRIMGLCLTAGLCEVSQLEFSIGNLKLFNTYAMPKFHSVGDFVDGILQLAEAFGTVGYKCFMSRSLLPLLGSGQMVTLEERLNDTRLKISSYCLGNLKIEYDLDDQELEDMIATLALDLTAKITATNNLSERRLYDALMRQLTDLRIIFKKYRTCGRPRMKPYTVAVVGGPGCGKSVITDQLAEIAMAAQHEEYDRSIHYLRWNPEDEYNSMANNRIKVVVIDDLANGKDPKNNPIDAFIQLSNNVTFPVAQAEVENKRGIELAPSVVIASSNMMDLGASLYSNEPASVTRRPEVFIELHPHDRYCYPGTKQLDGDKVLNNYNGPDTFYKDLFTVSAYRYDVLEKVGNAKAAHRRVNILERASYADFWHWFVGDVKRQRAVQEKLLKEVRAISSEHLCMVNCLPRHLCAPGTYVPHGTVKLLESTRRCLDLLYNYDTHKIGHLIQVLPQKVITTFEKSPIQLPTKVVKSFKELSIIPTPIRNYVQKTILVSKGSVNLCLIYLKYSTAFIWLCAISLPLSFFLSAKILYIPTIVFFCFAIYARFVIRAAEYVAERSKISIDDWKTWFKEDFVPYCILGYLIYKLVPFLKVVQNVRNMHNPGKFLEHGNVDPQTNLDIAERDAQQNIWVKPVIRELPKSQRCLSTTAEQLAVRCEGNLVVATADLPKGYARVNGLYIGSNVLVLPYHFVTLVGAHKVNFKKFDDSVGGNFSNHINDRWVRIPDTDLCLVYTSNSGTKASLIDYFPTDYLKTSKIYSLFVCKDPETCEIIRDRVVLQPERVSHSQMTFDGYTGLYTAAPRRGMCCGTLITDGAGPQIFAFHLGGDDRMACAGRVCRSEIVDAFNRLRAIPGVLPAGHEGLFRNVRDGRTVVSTQEVSRKSSVNFVTSQPFEVFGRVNDRSHPKSMYKPTLISESVEKHTGVSNGWTRPMLKGPGIYPYTTNLQKCADGCRGMPPDALSWAVKDYYYPIRDKIASLPLLAESIRPWTDEEALSGIPGMKFCDAMALKTSAGFGLPGKKSKYVVDVLDDEGFYSHRKPTPELKDELNYIESCWARGERSDSVFKSALKDEPVPIGSEKVRVFQGGPMAHYLGAKKRIGSIIRALRMVNLTSETAVGTDPTSPEWDQLMTHAIHFGEDRVIAGDYSGFDKRLPADVLSAFWWVIHELASDFGYDEQTLKEIRALSSDSVYSYQLYDGTLLRMCGTEPSGQFITVDSGGGAGCLLARCAYYHVCKKHGYPLRPFRDVVKFLHNGDDHIGSVHESIPEFNQISMAEYLTSMGMKYTGTDKDADVTEPYSHIRDTDFLKRQTASVEGLSFRVGVLTKDSIFKALHARLASNEVSDEAHAAQVIGGALREAMFHGRDFYEQLRSQLTEVAREHDLLNICPELLYGYDSAIGAHQERHCPSGTNSGRKVENGGRYMDDHDNTRLPTVSEVGGFDVQAEVVFTTGVPPKKRAHHGGRLSSLLLIMMSMLTTTEDKPSDLMKETATEVVPLGSTTEQNVYYHEEATSFITSRDDEKSMAHTTGTMNDILLGEFVQRPVRIGTISWAVGGAVETNFNPFQQYFANPSVNNKIKNFYRIQCGMRVKFQLVGNQFNYGRLMVAYQPFVTNNGQNLNQMFPWPGVAAPFTPESADLCLLSQYPHLYLDPVNNAGGEIEIPFVWFRNYFEVPTQDWIFAGSIIVTTLSTLEAANGSTDPVTIQIIAQPIGFSMDVPTQFEPQSEVVFDMQMNFVKSVSQFDPSHPISSGLGIASEGAGMMAKAKGKKKNKKARKFAKGSKSAELALKMAGNMASKFGFTRQPNAMGCNPYVPRFMNTFALTEGTSEGVPLTCYLDSQITIAPERFGVGNTDELTISSIACKEAYFNKFTWSVSDGPGTNLFGCEVSPAIWTTNAGNSMVGMTPACFAVMPFEFWSGTINFRFQVVTSSFHKGILLIKYDPDSQATGTDLNLQTLASIDISKDRDITVEVGMSQIVPWLYHRRVLTASQPANGGGGLPPYNAQGPFLNNSVPTIAQTVGDYVTNWKERLCLNGVISVQVFNSLVIPENATSQSVDILCHMSAGSDFKVGSPTDAYIRDMTFFPPVPPQLVEQTVATEPPDPAPGERVFEIQMDSSNDPVGPRDGAPEALSIQHHFGAELPDGTMICEQYMGECIESLRVLLHRKQYHEAIFLNANLSIVSYNVLYISDFPNFAGDVRINLNNTTQARRNVNMTMLHYVSAAYALRSGSISNTYSVSNASNQLLDPGTIKVSRAEKGAIADVANINAGTDTAFIYNGSRRQGRMANLSGMHASSRLLNNVLDVNLPYYDNLNGYPAQMSALDEGNVFCRCHCLEIYERGIQGLLERFVAAGPDYALGMFLSAPPVYQRNFTVA